jgi:hypothetical protein
LLLRRKRKIPDAGIFTFEFSAGSSVNLSPSPSPALKRGRKADPFQKPKFFLFSPLQGEGWEELEGEVGRVKSTS